MVQERAECALQADGDCLHPAGDHHQQLDAGECADDSLVLRQGLCGQRRVHAGQLCLRRAVCGDGQLRLHGSQCPAGGPGRSAPAEVVEAGLRIVLLPNPLTNGRLRAVITGAEGQPLSVELLDLRGMARHQQQWETAVPAQTVDWDVSQQPAGVYLLRAVSRGTSGISQRQILKVLKPD